MRAFIAPTIKDTVNFVDFRYFYSIMSYGNIFCINLTAHTFTITEKITRFMAGVKKGVSCKDHVTNLTYFLLTS